MKKKHVIIFCLLLVGSCGKPSVNAQSGVSEVVREFEELRLRQLQSVQQQGDIALFTTDGCSGYLSKSWELLADRLPFFKERFGDKPPWEACCLAHDKVYWSGKAVDGYAKRKKADEELKQCVIDTGIKLARQLSLKHNSSEEEILEAFSDTAERMYQTVRLGGQPCSLLPWRWGYGWPNCAFESIHAVSESYSDIEKDQSIVFFNTAGWLDADKTHWNVPLHAWIFEPEDSVGRAWLFALLMESKYNLKVTTDTAHIFRRRTNLFLSDSEDEKRIVVRVAGMDFTLQSDDSGHAFKIVKIPEKVINAFSINGRLLFFAVMQADDTRRFEGEVQLVSPNGFSVISDIDDTVKISNVKNRKLLFENTFFKEFREVPGMPDMYQKFAAFNIPIHFVSSSPWQLYDPLQEFLHDAGFPWATLALKRITFENLSKKGTETKPGQIEPIMNRYPGRKFILIGDSGEEDPEVYCDIARRYPNQVHRILIRKVPKDDDKTEGDDWYSKAFKNIARSKWQLFDHPAQIAVNKLLSK